MIWGIDLAMAAAGLALALVLVALVWLRLITSALDELIDKERDLRFEVAATDQRADREEERLDTLQVDLAELQNGHNGLEADLAAFQDEIEARLEWVDNELSETYDEKNEAIGHLRTLVKTVSGFDPEGLTPKERKSLKVAKKFLENYDGGYVD